MYVYVYLSILFSSYESKKTDDFYSLIIEAYSEVKLSVKIKETSLIF